MYTCMFAFMCTYVTVILSYRSGIICLYTFLFTNFSPSISLTLEELPKNFFASVLFVNSSKFKVLLSCYNACFSCTCVRAQTNLAPFIFLMFQTFQYYMFRINCNFTKQIYITCRYIKCQPSYYNAEIKILAMVIKIESLIIIVLQSSCYV